MKEDDVQKLDFGDEFLLDSAESRLESGDYLGALTVLNKRAQLHEPSADAAALYADVYEDMELWPMAVDSWFRFLDTCNEADFGEGYEGLAVCYMNMGDEVQSFLYYHRTFQDGGNLSDAGAERLSGAIEGLGLSPRLRIVHSEQGDSDPVALQQGFLLLKSGELEAAREQLSEIPPDSTDYPSAAGLSAMCTLMLGDEERAERECEALLKEFPDNVQALTTYCAVLGARGNKEGAREVARHLDSLPVEGVDDLYRVATALCETELDEEAFRRLTGLADKLPYDENMLWFRAVAAHRTGRTEEAISCLETLTTVYPRKAVARYYLERLRRFRDGEEENFPINYFYRLPPEEYRTVADFLLKASAASEEALTYYAGLPEVTEFFRLAFDEAEGHDEKLQLLAAKVAIKCRLDSLLRDVLLDHTGTESVKVSILHELTVRNEDNSFGVVLYGLYKEYFTHKLDLGPRKRGAFLKAFSDVYSRYAILAEENEGKLCDAAEDIYATLSEAGMWMLFDERNALAAAIYREARLKGGEHSLTAISSMFQANEAQVREILDYMM